MPEFVLPAEADRCHHCGGILYDPPNCCSKAMSDYCAAEQWDEMKEKADWSSEDIYRNEG